MGVSGAGKTTIGQLLASQLGWPFYDADDFHPPANVRAMRAGRPLTDADRAAWLDALRTWIAALVHGGTSAIIACSALKQSYRDRLIPQGARAGDDVRFVYLKGTPELIRQRIAARTGHFMPVALLPSQFATLEEPQPPSALIVDITPTPAEIVRDIRARLHL